MEVYYEMQAPLRSSLKKNYNKVSKIVMQLAETGMAHQIRKKEYGYRTK